MSVMKEPMWLQAKTDQKLAEMRDTLTPERLAGFKAVHIELVDKPAPVEGVDDTCDNCGTPLPVGTEFIMGQARKTVHDTIVYLSFGACFGCMGMER